MLVSIRAASLLSEARRARHWCLPVHCDYGRRRRRRRRRRRLRRRHHVARPAVRAVRAVRAGPSGDADLVGPILAERVVCVRSSEAKRVSEAVVGAQHGRWRRGQRGRRRRQAGRWRARRRGRRQGRGRRRRGRQVSPRPAIVAIGAELACVAIGAGMPVLAVRVVDELRGIFIEGRAARVLADGRRGRGRRRQRRRRGRRRKGPCEAKPCATTEARASE